MKIKKGDNVKMIAGKDRGRTGKILRVLRVRERVVVDGVNMLKRHVRPRRQGQKGEVIQFASSVHVSNVELVCGSCGKATRAGYRLEGEKKIRVCKKCGSAI
ncbi:MAG: 50S ribosomal protein L24 [Candidatus Ryanbacteria bacterium RIFCSPHIGHO2_02_FULL_45_17b]|uniref:Large ribosomal subunit protein uL24 n=1 Tax=Candidatus Ryanbacteria bacterium RIFCSPHIGHO2_01_FULL_45_22 TaxID=1802114 RepID=A0A1G2G226_9BACT|nr:MAG: 50S ribosomal protein L24 [Candidatus Ryanbacteria bacterium RIFCSPHIGHO2_01_FULL_45_22]OGZ46455.1 MAG: 50S ribosomal protein L24 [Candidatus Ryanbacteria bacterium RIFCSPHIGHO2_02_FULL_45_17b]